MNIGYFVTLSPIGQERPWLTTRPSSNSFARQKQKLDWDVEPIWIEKTMKPANIFQVNKRHLSISNRIVSYRAGITRSFRTSVFAKRKSNFSVRSKTQLNSRMMRVANSNSDMRIGLVMKRIGRKKKGTLCESLLAVSGGNDPPARVRLVADRAVEPGRRKVGKQVLFRVALPQVAVI